MSAAPAAPAAARPAVAWTAIARSYDAERAAASLPRAAVDAAAHPLAPARGAAPVVVLRAAGAPAPAAPAAARGAPPPAIEVDPLSAMAAAAELDPLSAMAGMSLGGGGGGGSGGSLASAARTPLASATSSPAARGGGGGGGGGSGGVGGGDDDEGSFVRTVASMRSDWQAAAGAIMREFTAPGTIRVAATFLSREFDGVASPDEAAPVLLDKARARIEALEAPDDGSVEISQKEYVTTIEKLHRDLKQAWDKSERVRSLKIAIQVSKLLLDVKLPAFYPSMFVLCTEILDTFGDSVFERIRARAAEAESTMSSAGGGHRGSVTGAGAGLPPDFSAADVNVEAKETCRNWIHKTACIRELLPRLFIEMCLLPCYRFISDEEYPAIVTRLFGSIRGLGNPLLAVYARTYLARQVAKLLAGRAGRGRLLPGVMDYLFAFEDLKLRKAHAMLAVYGLPLAGVLRLHEPGVAWQLRQLGDGADEDTFRAVLGRYRDRCNNSMVLKHILLSFRGALWCAHVPSMLKLIAEAEPSNVPQAELYRALAAGLIATPPPPAVRLQLLNDAWKSIGGVTDPVHYAQCASTFIELLVRHYSEREVSILLDDVVTHMSAAAEDAGGALPPAAAPHLVTLMTTLVEYRPPGAAPGGGGGGSSIITSDGFLRLLDLFESEAKTALCMSLLTSFTRSPAPTRDTVMIHTMFDVARNLHDSLDSLSVGDQRRQVAALICKFVVKFDFARDLEHQLDMLVQCRAAFANLDVVKGRLVHCVLAVAARALSIMKGRHNAKTAAFAKACFAYAHTTIPSVDSVFGRMALFKLAGEAALVHRCLPQADTFFKAAIQEIADLPPTDDGGDGGGRRAGVSTEPRLVAFLESLVGALLVMPGHPDHGPFYLVRGLVKALDTYAPRDTHLHFS